jgi:hypothetical protein
MKFENGRAQSALSSEGRTGSGPAFGFNGPGGIDEITELGFGHPASAREQGDPETAEIAQKIRLVRGNVPGVLDPSPFFSVWAPIKTDGLIVVDDFQMEGIAAKGKAGDPSLNARAGPSKRPFPTSGPATR